MVGTAAAGAAGEPKRDSVQSTHSGMSYMDPYEKPRKGSIQTYLFGAGPKKQGGYTSLFERKLLPPLGFYREVDKYCKMKAQYKSDHKKIEALNEMWDDYKKYQIRKRFRWPPTLFFKKFFWTTGYYADYQKTHRATRIRRPGDDSSDDELADNIVGAFLVAGGNHDDVNLQEFQRYQDAKKRVKRLSMKMGGNAFDDVGNANNMLEPKSTETRLFGSPDPHKGQSALDKQKHEDKEKKGPRASTVEEIETVVEYTLIKNPDKKKKDKKDKKGKGGDGMAELTDEEAAHAAAGKKVVSKKMSIVTTRIDPKTGQVLKDVKETAERGIVH